MMTTLAWILSAALWAQDPTPPPATPPRPERRDPFEGPRVPNPPPPAPAPAPERRPLQPPPNFDEVRAWLKENEPESFRRVMQFQEEGKREDWTRLLMDAGARMRELRDLKERDPKGFEKTMELRRLERESMEQAELARRAPPEEREAAMKKVKETLSRLFDLREEARQREIGELKRRVEALEKALAERKTNKDRIVEKRRRELMGEKSEDDW
jgi:hypothetical protein